MMYEVRELIAAVGRFFESYDAQERIAAEYASELRSGGDGKCIQPLLNDADRAVKKLRKDVNKAVAAVVKRDGSP